MSDFLIGCITIVLLALILQIKNYFKNCILKRSIVEAVRDITIKALDEGIKELDIKIFEKILEKEEDE